MNDFFVHVVWHPIYSVSLTFILYWFFAYGSQSNQIILKNFILKFLKNIIKPPSLQKGSHQISSVHLSICPSVCLSVVCLSVCLWNIFLRIYWVDVLNFLHEDILLTKKWQSQILEICICFLDNWVNKTNLVKEGNIWHFNRGSIAFCALTDAFCALAILWKLHVWGKSGQKCSLPIRW